MHGIYWSTSSWVPVLTATSELYLESSGVELHVLQFISQLHDIRWAFGLDCCLSPVGSEQPLDSSSTVIRDACLMRVDLPEWGLRGAQHRDGGDRQCCCPSCSQIDLPAVHTFTSASTRSLLPQHNCLGIAPLVALLRQQFNNRC